MSQELICGICLTAWPITLSEYGDNNGFIHAFNEGGEYFWAGAKGSLEQRKLLVQPLRIVKVTT
jgi:hypothetical protein